MSDSPHISTYWHDAYIAAARVAYPAATKRHDLAVGWKITRPDGTTHGGYYWPLVNGDHDLPVLHEATGWVDGNRGSCPIVEGDGLCLVTTHASEASSGGLRLTGSTGHVLVYPADLARSDTPGKWRVPWCVDVDCFDPVELIRLGLSGAELSGANLYGADLSRANLYGANLPGANLYGADLSGANLPGANLSGADLSGANLSRANLSRAILYGAILSGAELSGANLYGADLSRAILYGAILSGAILYGANLYGAILSGAELSRANLSGANLSGAELSGANLYGARGGATATWPTGFDWQKAVK